MKLAYAIVLLDASGTGSADGVGGVSIGEMQKEISSSEYAKTVHGIVGGAPPSIDLAAEKRLIECLVQLASEKLVASAHDVSDGGIAVTLAESCLASEGLSAEVALDAAGVSIEQIQRDAKARQDALDAYESSQKKQSEAEWTRKAEEIAQIQSELESIKAHYTARIGRCTEALARDKARFNSWVTAKEQDSRNMAEAVELCVKPLCETPPALKPAMVEAASMAMASAAAAGTGNCVTGSGKPV